MGKNKNYAFLNILKYGASFAFAFAILYMLFQHQNPVKLFEEIRKVEISWVILSMIFGALAYVSRGLRWIVLIDALGYKSSKMNSISAVSIGYFTNMFIPRAGEISRCAALNQAEKIPVDKLFGTILVERVIDFIFLFALIILTLFLKLDDLLKFFTTLQAHQTDADMGENDFYPIVLPWDMHPDRDQEWFENETKNMSRRQIAQELECNFNTSGETVIDPDCMKYLLENVKEPKHRTGFDRNFWIWEEHDPTCNYLMVADVARGDGADYSTFHIIKLETLTSCTSVGLYKYPILAVAISVIPSGL